MVFFFTTETMHATPEADTAHAADLVSAHLLVSRCFDATDLSSLNPFEKNVLLLALLPLTEEEEEHDGVCAEDAAGVEKCVVARHRMVPYLAQKLPKTNNELSQINNFYLYTQTIYDGFANIIRKRIVYSKPRR